MNRPAVETEHLNVRIGDHDALVDIHLAIPGSSFVAIVGPNGAGKSTFLKVLTGLVLPSTGTVRIFDRPLREVPPQTIGYVPQLKTLDHTFPALSIELVMTGLSRSWPWGRGETMRNKALAALEQVGAAHLAFRQSGKLSGGELQRIYLARSIVREPELVLLDEPATGIDAVGEEDFYRRLETFQEKSGATILMITHDWHAARHHADHVLLLNRKQISFGPPREVLTEKYLRKAFGHIGHEHGYEFPESSHE
jgi:zinc transport system ATP-binding protein